MWKMGAHAVGGRWSRAPAVGRGQGAHTMQSGGGHPPLGVLSNSCSPVCMMEASVPDKWKEKQASYSVVKPMLTKLVPCSSEE
jgi:hypothetical protein